MVTATPDPHASSGGRLLSSLRLLVDVRAAELASLLLAFLYFFFVMSAWQVLTPLLRAGGVKRLYLFSDGASKHFKSRSALGSSHSHVTLA